MGTMSILLKIATISGMKTKFQAEAKHHRFSQQPELLGGRAVGDADDFKEHMLGWGAARCWNRDGQRGVTAPGGSEASTEHPAQLDVLAAALGSTTAPC